MSRAVLCVQLGLLIAAIHAGTADARPGDLDPTFSEDGWVSFDTHASSYGTDVAAYPDGGVVASGYGFAERGSLLETGLVARLLRDGSPDPAFGQDGLVTTTFGAPDGARLNSVILDSDGRLLVAGRISGVLNPTAAVMRLRPDGGLDSSYSDDGISMADLPPGSEVSDLAPYPGGRAIVVGSGTRGSGVARLDPEGDPDPSFALDGSVHFPESAVEDLFAVDIDEAGRVYAVGSARGPGSRELVILRFTPAGTLDTTFSDDGAVTVPCPRGCSQTHSGDVAVLSDGGILASGALSAPGAKSRISFDFTIKLLENGAVDSGFGDGGFYEWESPALLALDDGGYATVETSAVSVTRRTSSGAGDPTWGDGGIAFTNATNRDYLQGLDASSEGDIVAAARTATPEGESRLAVFRFLGAPGPPDADADGLHDPRDRCPRRFGDREDGCPRFVPRVVLRYGRLERATGPSQRRLHGYVRPADLGCPTEPIRLFERRPGRDRRVAAGDSVAAFQDAIVRPRGAEGFLGPPGVAKGAYYARLKQRFDSWVGTCASARSRTVRVG